MKHRWREAVIVACFLISLFWVSGLRAQPQGGVRGVAQQVINSGGYTYVVVKSDKGEVWVALPPVLVVKGDRVEVAPGDAMVMRDFKSRSLNRTFKEILFASRAKVNGKMEPSGGVFHGVAGAMSGCMAFPPVAPSFQLPGEKKAKGAATSHAGMGSMDSFHGRSPHGGMGFKVAFPPKGSIKPPKGGYTVAQLYEKAKELNGKEVVVRGKVVKFLPDIMRKNWFHIADGSGKDGKAEITVTTQTVVKLGDIVVVKGKLAANKDFGYGYFYKAIIEDARVKVEEK